MKRVDPVSFFALLFFVPKLSLALDELPQVLDLITGDMSFVGERDIIVTTKKNIVFSRVVAANSVSL